MVSSEQHPTHTIAKAIENACRHDAAYRDTSEDLSGNMVQLREVACGSWLEES